MQTILVAHGALGSAAQMQPLAEMLAMLPGVAVTVVEFPGHGRTPLIDDTLFRLDHFVDVLSDSVSAVIGAKPLLFGYSMGGYVGLALEARSPGTFAGIVTLGTKFDWTPDGAAREAQRLDPAVISETVPTFAAVLAERHIHVGGWERHLERTAAMMRISGDSPLLDDQQLASIRCPVCVAVGTRDDVVNLAESERAAAIMVNGSCVPLNDVAHPIEKVPLELVVTLMAAFRAGIRARTL